MIKVLIFDWGDTLMIDDPGRKEPMAFWENISLVPGVYDQLIRLSRIYSLCIASNAVASNAELMMKALKRVKIDHFFTYSYTSKELGANKPDPRFFQQLLSNMGVKAEECIMIGNDYEKDIIGANQAGIQAIWYNQDQIHKPPFLGSIIQSMNELSKAVEKLAGLSQS